MATTHPFPSRGRRGSVRPFSLIHFIFDLRFLTGCVMGVVLTGGYVSTDPPKTAPPPSVLPVVVAQAPDPVPEVHTYAGETSFIAREFAEIQVIPKRSTKTVPHMIARFDLERNCMQIKERDRFYFFPGGCMVFGSTVKDPSRFQQEYARTKAEESRWRAQESIARSL